MLTVGEARAQPFHSGHKMMNLGIHIAEYYGLQDFTLRVLETNYNQFVLVLLNMTSSNRLDIVHIFYDESLLHPTGNLVNGEFTRWLDTSRTHNFPQFHLSLREEVFPQTCGKGASNFIHSCRAFVVIHRWWLKTVIVTLAWLR